MEDIYYYIWLSILNFSQIEKIKLLEVFHEPKKIYNLNKKHLKKLTNSEEIINKILDPLKRDQANKIITIATKDNIKIITHKNSLYSKKLKQIYDYPIVLYTKGNTRLLNTESISIVGCRNCSEYGRKMALKYGYLLARKNITIVSGLAKGIDTYAHKAALIAKGNTIAVLGSGINYIYPQENKKLYTDILNNNGLILSEYGIYTKPLPEYFPERNRIISGLANKILVVEAGRKSGSIITANIAAEQGKHVYAIPGNITNENSEGTNNLIKEGAILVSSLEDILDL